MDLVRDAVGPDELSCEEVRERHGDYVDGLMPIDAAAEVQSHLDVCDSCARYDRVVRRGLELVRALPQLAPSPDFEQRLQHRIFHLQDGASLAHERPLAGVGIAAAVAGLIALVAWSPILLHNRTPDAVRMVASTAASEERAAEPVPPADLLTSSLAGWQATPAPALLTHGVTTRLNVFPGPYSPLIVQPPVHGAVVRTISTESRAFE